MTECPGLSDELCQHVPSQSLVWGVDQDYVARVNGQSSNAPFTSPVVAVHMNRWVLGIRWFSDNSLHVRFPFYSTWLGVGAVSEKE